MTIKITLRFFSHLVVVRKGMILQSVDASIGYKEMQRVS
jgi:hypothetical protein